MQNPIIAITDKVMRMIKSMVFLSLKVGHRRGATIADIEIFLKHWAPSERGMYHQGIIERVLRELQTDGRVAQAGPRWYLAGT
jgi:hypothetical protein